ncbi:hypothetical protein ACF0H5_002084 [Mactra antiquata]
MGRGFRLGTIFTGGCMAIAGGLYALVGNKSSNLTDEEKMRKFKLTPAEFKKNQENNQKIIESLRRNSRAPEK